MTGLPAVDRFGLWADGLSTAERRARLRCMRAIVHLCCGTRGEAMAEALRLAEWDAAAPGQSVAALGRLPPLDRRRVLATYARLHRS